MNNNNNDNENHKDNNCNDSGSSSEESDIDNANNRIMDESVTQLQDLQKQNDKLHTQIEESNIQIDNMMKSILSIDNSNNSNNKSDKVNNELQLYRQMINQQYTQLKQLMGYCQ